MKTQSQTLLGSFALFGALLAVFGSSPAPAQAGDHGKKNVVQFDAMYGVDGPFVNSDVIRGVLGDELPWSVREAHGSLDSDGHLSVKVKGLVFKDDPSVPRDLRGINDEATFRALVSCLTESGIGVVVQNVVSSPFPATRKGDSDIRTTIQLPNPCVAPIVFVLSGSEDKWFSVIGNEN